MTETNGTRKVRRGAWKRGEKKAKVWLEENGFKISEHWTKGRGKAHPGPYDIRAEKGGDRWAIEVKSQVTRGEPKVKIDNLKRIIAMQGVRMAGLLFDPLDRDPILFVHDKQVMAGLKRATTLGPEEMHKIALRAVATRRLRGS